MSNKKQVALQVEEEVYEILKMKAERLDTSIAELLRGAVYEVAELTNSPLEVAKMMLELERYRSNATTGPTNSTKAAKSAAKNVDTTKTSTTAKK